MKRVGKGLHFTATLMVALCISLFPYVVPGAVAIWEAATDRSGQVFMLWGTALVLPMILGYTAWSYGVFRGKTGALLAVALVIRLALSP